MDLIDLTRRLVLMLVPMILSLTVHEYAHAWSATKLGDPTARGAGRLTLDPRAHIDLWGTILIPAMSVLMGGMAFIGWAKPTPFRPDRFKKGVDRRFGAAVVAAAGPLSNILLAVLAAAGLSALHHAHIHTEAVAMLLGSMFFLNIGLAIFNLLPIPPLDGHRLLPPAFDPIVRPLERYGFAIIMVIFMLLPGVADIIFRKPLHFVAGAIASIFGLEI
jgi:Zn-dependent protease